MHGLLWRFASDAIWAQRTVSPSGYTIQDENAVWRLRCSQQRWHWWRCRWLNHLCMRFNVRSMCRVVWAIFYSLTFTASSPPPSATTQSPLTPPLQWQSALATTEAQSATTVVVVEMQMTQSSPHIRLGYSRFSIVHAFHSPQRASSRTSNFL